MPARPKDTLEQLLQHLGFNTTVEEHHLEEGLLLEVKSDDAGRLIGRQGQTLGDLQYILNRLLFHQDKDAAEKVRRWGDIVELEPMNAFDRRIIHNALKDDPGVETHSVEVEGTNKKAILLRPKH